MAAHLTEQEDDELLAITSMGVTLGSYSDACCLRRKANRAIGDGDLATFEWRGQRLRVERTNDGDGVDYLVVGKE
jgi:hypothetical protein